MCGTQKQNQYKPLKIKEYAGDYYGFRVRSIFGCCDDEKRRGI